MARSKSSYRTIFSEGVDTVLQDLRSLGDFSKAHKIVADNTREMSLKAGENTPVLTGRLKSSKRARFSGDKKSATGIVYYDTDVAYYAALIEYGGFNPANSIIYRQQRYLGRAFDSQKDKYLFEIGNDLDKAYYNRHGSYKSSLKKQREREL